MFFFSSRRRHTRFDCDWSSDVCSSDLAKKPPAGRISKLAHHTTATAVETHDGARMSQSGIFGDRKSGRVGKECRSRWSPSGEKKHHRRASRQRESGQREGLVVGGRRLV